MAYGGRFALRADVRASTGALRRAQPLLQVLAKGIPGKFGFDPVNDVQVLTPMHRVLLGASSLNAVLQAPLNPQVASIVHGAGCSARATRACGSGTTTTWRSSTVTSGASRPSTRKTAPSPSGSMAGLSLASDTTSTNLRLLHPQVAGERVPVSDLAGPHTALRDAPAEPALHRHHPGSEARGSDRQQPHLGHRREERQDRGALHSARSSARTGDRSDLCTEGSSLLPSGSSGAVAGCWMRSGVGTA